MDSPVSIAMMPSGASMNDWFDKPLPTKFHTPLRTSLKPAVMTSL
jgi:hypothetical protein